MNRLYSRRETAHVFARETLRMAILNGLLPGGFHLVQSDLAAELAISTTPIREALRDLAAEGLVHIDAHRGAIVRELDTADYDEIQLIREQLEPLAMKLALPAITDGEIAAARSIHEQMCAGPDLATFVELNRRFHSQLYRPCQRPRLVSIVQQLQDEAVMASSANVNIATIRRKACAEHGQILEAVAARDVERTLELLGEHIGLAERSTD